ncbi:uncharacterized protein LOC121376308 [Gigantopelta aegis]|uniref:uncharacterized protein LOC121376308 n=1 Tax=Gigantopelta aegis TaxID=1735272 RepID=UPI001B88AD2D|nr:uncharacterized protein LOC121376308 [Gigantopelta aegis]
MLSRIIPAVRSISSVTRFQAVRCMSEHAPAHWKTDRDIARDHQCTMDDMPVPAGSWQEQYNKVNSKYNVYLAISSVFFVATMYMVTKTEAMPLNLSPDMKKPADC